MLAFGLLHLRRSTVSEANGDGAGKALALSTAWQLHIGNSLGSTVRDLAGASEMRRSPLGILLSTLGLFACHESQATASEARLAAEKYLHGRSYSTGGSPVTVEDQGGEWAVTYHLPAGFVGGDLIVWVDKETREVVGFVGGQ